MSAPHRVHVRSWEAGDWYEVYVDDVPIVLNSNHSIGKWDMIEVLKRCGVGVTTETVREEEDE